MKEKSIKECVFDLTLDALLLGQGKALKTTFGFAKDWRLFNDTRFTEEFFLTTIDGTSRMTIGSVSSLLPQRNNNTNSFASAVVSSLIGIANPLINAITRIMNNIWGK